jgi:superoxide dismutase, Fe-Mn family
MYEHSYHIYGTKAAAYVGAYMQNINWTGVAQAYAATPRRA